jgi:hypothetical protein
MNESLTLRDIHTLLLNIPLYYFSAAETNSLTFIIMSLYNLDVSSWTENIMQICIYLHGDLFSILHSVYSFLF